MVISESEPALRQVIETLGANESAFKRLIHLINKTWANTQAQQIITLLQQYNRYYFAEQQIIEQNTTQERLSGQQALEQFRAIKALRQAHFGADKATQLFGQQELAQEYFLGRRAINEDTTLSRKQKRLAIKKLEASLYAKQPSSKL